MTLAVVPAHHLEQDLGVSLNSESTMVACWGPTEDAVGRDEVVSVVPAPRLAQMRLSEDGTKSHLRAWTVSPYSLPTFHAVLAVVFWPLVLFLGDHDSSSAVDDLGKNQAFSHVQGIKWNF